MVAKIYYAELWGLREGKYNALFDIDVHTTQWAELKPGSPFYLFVPRDEAQLDEYEKGWQITDIFHVNSVGIVTARDHFVLDFDETILKDRINNFQATVLSDDEIRERFKLADKEGWSVSGARQAIRQDKDWAKASTKCLYRPFDIRPLFYHKAVIERSRPEVMRHMMQKNISIVCPRRVETVGTWQHVLISSQIIEHVAVSLKTIDSAFPLYLYPAKGKMQFDAGSRRPNLNPEFVNEISKKLALKFVEDGKGDLKETFGPEDIFHYAYAVFHSPAYRVRYAEFLKMDFPRLPLTSNKQLFQALAAKGAELVALHLMESPLLNNLITKYPVAGSSTVDKVNYDENSQRAYINKTQYFEGISPDVWSFHIGGYQVCQKWLKDRKGRKLTIDEAQHYQRIVVALKETIRLMEEIDQTIPGWPIE